MTIKLPITIPFEEDETLYSWTFRMYKANLYRTRRLFESDFCRGQTIHSDGYGFSGGILLGSRFCDKQNLVYTRHTLYPFYAPFYTKEQQERVLHIQRTGFKNGSPVNYIESKNKELRFCPQCLREDDHLYLHRAHQMPGVKVCYKHRCKLLPLEKLYNGEEMRGLHREYKPDYRVSEEEMSYALFTRNFMEEAFDMDVFDLSKLISKRLEDLNIRSKEDLIFFFKISEKEITELQANIMLRTPEGLSEAFLEENLYTLFNSVEIFKIYYERYIDIAANTKLIEQLDKEGYQLISPYKKNLLEIKHKECGTSFLITEHGLKADLRCPRCQKLTDQELYELLFYSNTEGDFKLLSDFESSLESIKVRHSCGHEFSTKANPFYYKNMGCPVCLSKLTLEEAQARVNEVDPSYELLEYTALDKPATFLHKTCGNKLERRFDGFLRKNMFCPHCAEKEKIGMTDDFKDQLKALVGDEYQLIGNYLGDRQPITIKHMSCGQQQTYTRASYFLQGHRCSFCHATISDQDFKDYVLERTKGEYELIDLLPDRMAKVKNTKTGKVLEIKRPLLLQELARPTDSDLIVCQDKAPIERPVSKARSFYDLIVKTFPNGESFTPKDLYGRGFNKTQIGNHLRRFKKNHLVKQDKNGSYTLVVIEKK